MKRNIYLIGFMGAGKSTVAGRLNDRYGMQLTEMDAQIEKEEQMPISRIFQVHGEEYFREKETALLERIAGKENQVVSCGGGAAMRRHNVECMHRSGVVVYLTARPETVLSRVKGRHDRPLLEGHMEVPYIARMLEERHPRYLEASDLQVETDGRSIREIVMEIAVRCGLIRFRDILLDADETLLDFRSAERQAFSRTMEKYGIACSDTLFSAYQEINHGLWHAFEAGEIQKEDILKRRFRETFARLGIEGAFPGLEEYYQDALAQGHEKMPHAAEACRELAKQCRLWLVSNGVASTQKRRMRESGLEHYFEAFFISEEIGFQKPQKQYFDYVKEHIPGFCPEWTLAVGDSLHSDIRGAENSGIASCWYFRETPPPDAFTKADYVITDLNELISIVKGNDR